MNNIESSSIIITGASSGIGASLAIECARRGAALVGLLARNQSRLELVRQQVIELGCRPLILNADITDMEQVHRACDTFLDQAGPPDFLFVNAGIARIERPKHIDAQTARRTMEVNFHGAVSVLSELLPAMVGKGGRIVATSSIAAYRGMPGAAAYSASKAALDRYIEGLRVQYASTPLSFLLVEPGFVRTPLTEKNPFPMPFLLSPDEAAVKILDAAQTSRPRLTFPWPLALAVKALAMLPDRLYDALARRMPTEKPKK